jgi:N-carbamoyl-L-amino-acid hydrolase
MADQFSDHGPWHAQVLELLNAFGTFGNVGSGGITRLAASAEEQQARDYLCRWLKNHDFQILIDGIGNIFGVLDLGEDCGNRSFFCGSHLDSQPNGGNFDGALGVVCACIAGLYLKARTGRNELKPTFRYFVVTCWTGEEGARFQPSIIGSSVYTGRLSLEAAWIIVDSDGISLKDALRDTNYLGSDQPRWPDQYLELHIEQGTKLEASGDAVGLVESCWGAEKIRLLVTGKADHTGPTPMEKRRNALLAASRAIVALEEIAIASEGGLYCSVGRMELQPNSPNTVVNRAELWVEFRSASRELLTDGVRLFENEASRIAQQTGCDLTIIDREKRDVISFDPTMLADARSALDRYQIGYQILNTIAGHDAIHLQAVCPSTLMFVPSRDGITHSPLEFTSEKDVCAGFDGMVAVLSDLIARPEIRHIKGS